MSALPHLLRDAKLVLFDFDGVVTTEAEDVALKAQTLTVFAAISRRFGERALKMVRLVGQAVYKAGGSFSLGPLVYEAARLLKPAGEPLEPTLCALIDACVENLDYRCVAQAPPVIHQGLGRLAERRIQVGIYSNGVRANAVKILEVKGLTGLIPAEHIFDAIATRDDKGKLHPKPAREGFLKVLRELDVEPAACIFVDNSRRNVRAAKKAVGCRGGVYIGHSQKAKDRGVIDHVVPSLETLMGQILAIGEATGRKG